MSISIAATATTAIVTRTSGGRVGHGRSSSNKNCSFFSFRIRCSDSNPKRGFGAPSDNNKAPCSYLSSLHFHCDFTSAAEKGSKRPQRKSNKQSGSLPTQAPGLSAGFDGKPKSSTADFDFEERLLAVRRSALEQKRADVVKEFGPIDYDAPIESEKKTIGTGTKIGVGVAVLVFGLVFALGDFLPTGNDSTTQEAMVVNKKLPEEEKATLENRLKQYESTLSISPKDPVALEEKPNDPDVFRLLGEIKYELNDYEGSAGAYRMSAKVSKSTNFEVLRGLTNALLASKKPDEAVKFLLASRERLTSERSSAAGAKADDGQMKDQPEVVDPIQVDLLLGKAYSDWGHISDAASVYDQIISGHPNDFRGYLAKGVLLKENGNPGDAERMFIQARFFAPDRAKALVDRYARK
ncbi:unnamed protein product [Linum tenue]|uniref:Uncharacterized protein n=1 Tax=Linum tenue TaxID=586396 RepID=A0AAV0M5V0_9ROSI|nr:unnamed protein product [Linum tenue]